MNEFRIAVKSRAKELITFLIGMFIQSYFAYRFSIVYLLLKNMPDFYKNNTYSVITTTLGFVIGNMILLFIAYLYLKSRTKSPVLSLFKYIFIYLALQFVISVFIGYIGTFDIFSKSIDSIIEIFQTLFKFIFLWFVFISTSSGKTYKYKLKILISLIFTVLFVMLLNTMSNAQIENILLYIIAEAFYYSVLIIYIYISTRSGRETSYDK